YIERLTNEIETEAFSYIKKIDELGGMLRAVELGYPQREIAEASYRFQQRMDGKEYSMVGVNGYVDETQEEIPTLIIDPKLERDRIAAVKAYKSRRDAKRHAAAIEEIRRACKENRNVIPALIEGVEVGVTLGEVSALYREVFGIYTDPGMI